MPYDWIQQPNDKTQIMRLTPHESLPPKGMAIFILATFTLLMIPALAMLGTPLLWTLLPFSLLAVWGMYFALQQNHKQRQIVEVLTLKEDTVELTHTPAKGDPITWNCNRYWTQVTQHESGGPVPNYITLKGMGREVEIGAFLSEEERITLFNDLQHALKMV
jgi:uncharacterized membrane protein